jgi:hypothetical protein
MSTWCKSPRCIAKDTDHPLSRIDAFGVPAIKKLGIDLDDKDRCADIEEARTMFY